MSSNHHKWKAISIFLFTPTLNFQLHWSVSRTANCQFSMSLSQKVLHLPLLHNFPAQVSQLHIQPRVRSYKTIMLASSQSQILNTTPPTTSTSTFTLYGRTALSLGWRRKRTSRCASTPSNLTLRSRRRLRARATSWTWTVAAQAISRTTSCWRRCSSPTRTRSQHSSPRPCLMPSVGQRVSATSSGISIRISTWSLTLGTGTTGLTSSPWCGTSHGGVPSPDSSSHHSASAPRETANWLTDS